MSLGLDWYYFSFRYDEDDIGVIDGVKFMKKLGITLSEQKQSFGGQEQNTVAYNEQPVTPQTSKYNNTIARVPIDFATYEINDLAELCVCILLKTLPNITEILSG